MADKKDEIPVRGNGYPFKPKDMNLLAKGKDLATAYGISLNQLLTFALQSCIEEWTVPYMHKKAKPGEEVERVENEGVFEKPLTER